jgi:glucose 1-dehydrogenase
VSERSLGERRALVTGADSGIGRSVAKRLAMDGARVAVNFRSDEEAAQSLVAEIERDGGEAIAVQADVSHESDVLEMFDGAGEHFGAPVDLLVNNAGIEKAFKLVDMPLHEWEKVIAVNLTGAFLCARETARRLIERRDPGVIVNMSSVHELIPWREFSHYCASKAGMKLFGQTIAYELAPHRIRVVNIGPGAIVTPINEEVLEDPDKRREVEEQIPWGRMGKADEVAAAVAWLSGPEAEYITGVTLFVDGGMTLYPKFV